MPNRDIEERCDTVSSDREDHRRLSCFDLPVGVGFLGQTRRHFLLLRSRDRIENLAHHLQNLLLQHSPHCFHSGQCFAHPRNLAVLNFSSLT